MDLTLTSSDLTVEEVIALLPALAKDANSGCGLVYEVFERNLSVAIDKAVAHLPAYDQQYVTAVARNSVGYLSPTERHKEMLEMDSQGLCIHGLDEMTCPCGCFEGDDEIFEHIPHENDDCDFITAAHVELDNLLLDIEYQAGVKAWDAIIEIERLADKYREHYNI